MAVFRLYGCPHDGVSSRHGGLSGIVDVWLVRTEMSSDQARRWRVQNWSRVLHVLCCNFTSAGQSVGYTQILK